MQYRYSNPAEFLKSGPLPVSVAPPPPRPPAAFLPSFSSKARARHEEELNSTDLLQHTATNKKGGEKESVMNELEQLLGKTDFFQS